MDKLWIILAAAALILGLSTPGLCAKYRDLTAKCDDEGGRCATFAACDTVSNIYKGYCKTDYSQVCCVSRALVCDAHDGICTDDPEACEAAGAIMGIKYQIQFKTWLTCNSTHTCCRPLPKDKETGMSNFKSQFPENVQTRVIPTPVPVPAPPPAPAPAPAPVRVSLPAPATPDFRFLQAENPRMVSDEERQATIGEAVLAVLASNPSLSLKDAMQHPSVRLAAGEPPLPQAPVSRESLYSAEVGMGLRDAALQRRRQALRLRRRQLQRLQLQEQIRQAAAAREALLVQQQQQQQQQTSIFPGHTMGGNPVDSEIHKRLFSGGMDFPYARQLPLDPHQNYNQPDPFKANFPTPEQDYHPYQKQGVDAYNHMYTHRTLGEVEMPNAAAAPLPPADSSSGRGDKFGFKSNEDFMNGNRYGGYV